MERLQPQQITITGTPGALVQVSSTVYMLGALSDLLISADLLPGQI
jgi:hypothetical protein